MFASEFQSILEDHYPLVAKHFKGAYAFDKYPPDLAERDFILWNSSHGLPGEHWRIIYMHHSVVDVFDPLGLTEEKIKQWNLKFNGKHVVSFNGHQIQPDLSTSCGWFCLYFVIQRVYNPDLSMRQLLAEDFSLNPESNLEKIITFFTEDGINPESAGRS